MYVVNRDTINMDIGLKFFVFGLEVKVVGRCRYEVEEPTSLHPTFWFIIEVVNSRVSFVPGLCFVRGYSCLVLEKWEEVSVLKVLDTVRCWVIYALGMCVVRRLSCQVLEKWWEEGVVSGGRRV